MKTKLTVRYSITYVLPVLAAFEKFLLNYMTLQRSPRIEHREKI